MIAVTRTFLPPQEEYQAILKSAWDSRWITNEGVLLQRLSEKLKGQLEVENIILTANGTLPMHISIKALGLEGEIITTPFSYVATTSAIVWENSTPVYVDIDPLHLTIDENKIEAAITENTTAILATHVFGNPCNVEAIGRIADKHGLVVIYDAAHCFGVRYKGESLFNFGDISTCSFHGTKLFHTGEGGCITVQNPEYYDKLHYHYNFGHKGQLEFLSLGTNAKMSELQAALGLAILPYWDEIVGNRKRINDTYSKHLNSKAIQFLKLREHAEWNYSYFPAVFESEEILHKVTAELNAHEIYPRRYFYPSLNNLPYIKRDHHVPISDSISARILCLPSYNDLTNEEIITICNIINRSI